MKILSTQPAEGWYAVMRRPAPDSHMPPTTRRLVCWALVDFETDQPSEPIMVGMIQDTRGGYDLIPALDDQYFLGYWDGFGGPDEAIAQVLNMLARRDLENGDEGKAPPAPDPPIRKIPLTVIPQAYYDAWS